MEASGVRKITIAVDFGATFSGVAWAQSNNMSAMSSQPCSFSCLGIAPDDIGFQPDVHYLINQWPDVGSPTAVGGMTSEKIPN